MLHYFPVSKEILDSITYPGPTGQETEQFGQEVVNLEEKGQEFIHFLLDFSKCVHTIYRRIHCGTS